jgi:hypothetical protein
VVLLTARILSLQSDTGLRCGGASPTAPADRWPLAVCRDPNAAWPLQMVRTGDQAVAMRHTDLAATTRPVCAARSCATDRSAGSGSCAGAARSYPCRRWACDRRTTRSASVLLSNGTLPLRQRVGRRRLGRVGPDPCPRPPSD